MVSKVPDFDISKYQEKGELGKHLDKSLLSGTSGATSFKQDVSTVIDNLVHNLMAIYFQVETCVKSLSEGKFKWVNKEDLVSDLHNEIADIFNSIASHDPSKDYDTKYYDNMVAIHRNLGRFEEVYEILQKAGVDENTIKDIRTLLDNAERLLAANFKGKGTVKGVREKITEEMEKKGRKNKFDRGFPHLQQKGIRDDSDILKPKKHVVENKKSKTYEDYGSSVDTARVDKDYILDRKVKENVKKEREKELVPSKFTRRDAESLFSRKSSDTQKTEFETDKLMLGHPDRVKKLKQETSELKAQIKALEEELRSLEDEKPQLKQQDAEGNITKFPVTPAERKVELARVKELKARIPGVTKQLEEAKALLEKKRVELRSQDSPLKMEKRKLKNEVKQAAENEKLLKKQHKAAVKANKKPTERKEIREAMDKATLVLKEKKAAYEDFKQKHLK